MLERYLVSAGFSMYPEPKLECEESFFQPHIIGIKDNKVLVIETQVISYQRKVYTTHADKVSKGESY